MVDVRLSFFIFALVFFSLMECVIPKRQREFARSQRWPANFSIIVFSNIILKVILPLGLASICLFAKEYSLGLFNIIKVNFYVELFISIILLDMLIYFQHVISHRIDLLWKIHKVHHADVDIDLSTALRFHPIEILLSIAYKAFFIILFGLSSYSVLIFEILLNVSAMFGHANIRLPKKLNNVLAYVVVTPDFHVIHHSKESYETNSNYGFFLSLWDRLFKTYRPHFVSKAVTGLDQHRSLEDHKLLKLMKMPFSVK